MNKPKVYIDGKEGTTGLQIYERLGAREDIELLLIDEEKRKDVEERKKLLNAADLVFLCLPDAAAKEAVALIENDHTRVIDASTAHRTAKGWVYGFPEFYRYPGEVIGQATRVANPGCHATGFLSSTMPLVSLHILPKDYPLTCYSLTGYSGGGKKMIAEYESGEKGKDLYSPRIYGTNLRHKHLNEMRKISGLDQPPVFCPVVDDYYKGMATTIMLHNKYLLGQPTAKEIYHILMAYYAGQKLISVRYEEEGGMLPANTLAGSDRLELVVCGHEEQTIVTALFDNLGKGASGAAVQNMNIMLGLDETTGLHLD
ncbi:MAG: N-acetyl-gamma-glutamyl-phosphate reductase [Oscillospiraceae bacterium]|nr:N-acetyl-gamma-glutamyl-phosphate reductase [Oscillospiraceae bacterium]